MKTNVNELGYISNGEPTDAQIQLQDHIDSEIHRFMGTLRALYFHAADKEHQDEVWDINKITEIRNTVESVMKLPDVY